MELDVPYELESGVFADMLTVWHTPHHVVLDFGVARDSDSAISTARVRVAATAVLEVADRFSEGIGEYELQFGEIRRPRPRGDS